MGNTLEERAQAAWSLAFRGRHETNWGRLLICRSELERYRRDPHPAVRRIAYGFCQEPEHGRAA